MSQPSRAERRRQARGGAAPPPRRDPMRAVYIGIGIAIVALIVIFAGLNWWQNRKVQRAYATPTPGPITSAKPIQLADGQSLGTKFFKNKYPDTAQGGRGQAVDGIGCGTQEYATLHVHSHLAIFNDGKQIQIPQYIGFAPPQGGLYTLGMLFDIWGQPLQRQDVAGFVGPVTAYVNGTRYDGDLSAIPLGAHQQIVLMIGKPVAPPNYAFPPND
jgi:hypothetical protein